MTTFEERLAKLNPQQREAVETLQGPVLVVAGPGTGKTEMLAMRIANLLNQPDVNPNNILCITFTEAGASAMRKRLLSIIGKDAYFVTINTFHGFCNDVIQTHPEKFSQFASSPNQLDDLTRIKFLKQILDDLNIDQKQHLIPFHDRYSLIRDITSAIQTLKKEGVSPSQLREHQRKSLEDYSANPNLNKKTGEPTIQWKKGLIQIEKNLELAEIYDRYIELLDSNNYYDYDDMIMFVVEAFEGDPDLLADYWEKYQHILVDEYQDTNGSQNKLIRILGSYDSEPNIFAVGDDDQAIYRFQGANVDNLLFFEQNFENVKSLSIGTNYRSNQAILDLAQGSITKNENRLVNIIEGLNKTLVSGLKTANHKPEVYNFATGEAENRFIVQKIIELVEAGAQYSDIAILYRRHSDAADIIDSLLQAKLPIKVAAGDNVLNDPTVLKLLDILELIRFKTGSRNTLLAKVLFYDFVMESFGYTRLQVFKLLRHLNDSNYLNRGGKKLELFDLISDKKSLTDVAGENSEGLLKFSEMLVDWKAASQNDTLSQFIAKVMEQSGFRASVFNQSPSDIDAINAVNSFYQYVKDLTRADQDISHESLLENINLYSEYGLKISERKLDLDENGINLVTVHSAKGLEFRHVFIVKCFHKNWGGSADRRKIKLPMDLLELVDHDDDTKKNIRTEDDRRLFFVAVTRAKERLFLSSASAYYDGTSVMAKEPSQFITELAADLSVLPDTAQYEDISEEELAQNLMPLENLHLEAREKEYLRTLVDRFELSASSLNEYLESPKLFMYNRLLKIPMSTNKHTALGSSTHKALENLSRSLMAGESVDKQKLLDDFKESMSHQFLGGEEYIDALQEGSRLLDNYFEANYSSGPVAPAGVEYSFRKIPLEISGMEPILLTGKIDKIEWVDQSESTVKVVDYKTSSPKSEGQIRGTTKNSQGNIFRQLVFYKLMADLDPNFRPSGKTNKYRISSAEVDFLKPQSGKLKKVQIEITDQDVTDLKVEIAEVMVRIRNLEFEDVRV